MKISEKLRDAHADANSHPTFSFEYFPPKTPQGVQNLYERMDRMRGLGPQFVDVTWNAGGRLGTLSCEMISTAQNTIGLDTCLHLTCVGMDQAVIETALSSAHRAGCRNILALRGDLPVAAVAGGATNNLAAQGETTADSCDESRNTFRYAKDLVTFIRRLYGDYFCIGVAGYPEGTEESSAAQLVGHLKEKVDAGADFVITQMFYDAQSFVDWAHECTRAGISVPLIPGIMPISTYASFVHRATWCGIHVPAHFQSALEPVKNDDRLVRERGTRLIVDMCRKILDSGVTRHLHFYTMNLERATVMILEALQLVNKTVKTPRKPQDASLNSVHPIFWKNRQPSYLWRTQDWDEFPNGRWGDARSPAFGELETYGALLRQSRVAMDAWGAPQSMADLSSLFLRFVRGEVSSLPWCDEPIAPETREIRADLETMIKHGFLTVNSQPALDGVVSSDKVHGWGPGNGLVYQKAYLELLVPPETGERLLRHFEQRDDQVVTFYGVRNNGDLHTNSPGGPNAVTWGVFPGKEIIQPTIVEQISFMAWKDEAFALAREWARCFPAQSAARQFLDSISRDWYLINLVNNDFRQPRLLFEILTSLQR